MLTPGIEADGLREKLAKIDYLGIFLSGGSTLLLLVCVTFPSAGKSLIEMSGTHFGRWIFLCME
jgi:hypothetical protein